MTTTPSPRTAPDWIFDAPIHVLADFTWLNDFFDAKGSWCGPETSGLDIETEAVLLPHDGEACTVQIELWGECYVTHWDHTLTLAQVPGAVYFQAYLRSTRVLKLIHNAAFEHMFFLHAFGWQHRTAPVYDTMAVEYLLAEGAGFEDEDALAPTDGPKFRTELSLGAVVLRRYNIEMDKDRALRTSFRRRGIVTDHPPARKGGVPVCAQPGCTTAPDFLMGAKELPVCEAHYGHADYARLKVVLPLDAADYRGRRSVQGDLSERQVRYAAFDAFWCQQVYQDQQRDIALKVSYNYPKLRGLVTMECDFTEVIARMQLHGLPVNLDALIDLEAEFQYYEQNLREDVRAALWSADDVEPVNINSNPQMLAKLTNAGYAITNYESAQLKHFRGDKLIDDILAWKTYKKLQSTYTSAFLDKLHPKTSSLHCQINQFLTSTGRLSASKPNLQNLPSRTPLGRQVRKCVQAQDGYVFVIADYSNIEMRLIAEMFHDDNMIRAFNEKMDVHSITAARIMGLPYEEVVAAVKRADELKDAGENLPPALEAIVDGRTNAKPANFGLGYGAGVPKLRSIAWKQYDLDWSIEETSRIRMAYFDAYPGVQQYHRRIGEDIKHGSGAYRVYTQDGRMRRLPREWTNAKGEYKTCYSAALNHPIQGTSADMMKVALIRLVNELPDDCRLVLQIHDEVIVQVPLELAEAVRDQVSAVMQEVGQRYLTKMPCVVDGKIRQYWGK